MSGELEKLKHSRDQILLAEVGVWLHLLGKFSSQFFRDQIDGHSKKYKEFYKQLDQVFRDLYDNSWPESHWRIPSLTGLQWPQSFAQFSEKHDKPRFAQGKSPMTLAADAHGRGSGTDKSVQANNIYSQQQLPIHLATAFGYETSIDNARLDERRNELYKFIATTLEQIKSQLTNGKNTNWAEMLPTFIEKLREDFSITVGDTRRPINDVSLWAQTSATVAFFKPALAKNVLLGRWQNPLETRYKWRFLRVALDGLSYWGLANRIGDLRARQELVRSALDAVKKLLEITYPLSAEVYRDETGSVFLAPDEPAELLKLTEENGSTLEELIHREAASVLDGEVSVDLQLDDHATRNMFRAGQLLSQPLPPISAVSTKLQEWWSATTEQELCNLCALRPQGYGGRDDDETKVALNRDICCTCMDRLAGQARQWAQELERTIWIDEVSDRNARVALIVGQFDLAHWLDGIYVSSMTIPDPSSVDGQGHGYAKLLEEVKIGLAQNDLLNEQKSPLVSKILDEAVKKNLASFKKLDEFLVQEEDLAEIAGRAESHTCLALALVRKPPSFARIRRAWETTKRFWETIRDEFIPYKLDARPRIVFVGTFTSSLGESLQNHQAYELMVEGYRMPVFCKRRDQGQFLTIDNLEYAAKHLSLDDVQQILKSNTVYTLELPGGYGMRRRKVGAVTITKTQLASQRYCPHIPILAEPRTFMALVPADEAVEIAQQIKAKYEREMGKVRNRLPLHLGLIFFPRKQPLRAVLEAGRNVLDGLSRATPDDEATWEVGAVCEFNDHLPEWLRDDPHFRRGRTIKLESEDRRALWHVPLTMGDGKTDDKWYPYFFVEGDEDQLADRQRRFKGLRPIENGPVDCWLVHAEELRQGDKVYFTPSYFDFEFLDTSARRFDVSYSQDGQRRASTKRNRPYLLDDLQRFEEMWRLVKEGLSTAQIKQLDGLIEAKREEWEQGTGDKGYCETFERFVCDVLKNAEWKKGKRPMGEAFEELQHAALTGELHDVLELYMEILKRKPEHEQQGGEEGT